MKPRDIATRSQELYELRRLDPDGFLRKTFTLPVEEARAKAREIMGDFPSGGYMTIVERWRQLPDGQIEFVMRRVPTAIDADPVLPLPTSTSKESAMPATSQPHLGSAADVSPARAKTNIDSILSPIASQF
jgi:hypothetical protein